MSNGVISPLQEIIKRAAARDVQGPAAKAKARVEGTSDTVVVVADASGSMLDAVGALGMSKEEHLLIALKDLLTYMPKVRIVAFASLAREMSIADLEAGKGRALGGGTDLANALKVAAEMNPRKIIIISDGLPNSEEDAEDQVAAMKGAIDCIYCGPDGHPAVAWLRSLARSAGGAQYTWDGYRELGAVMRLALPAPAETGK